ncbi:alpha/beta fold hydrolase [Ramlibacter algicola]|uniref:Alpha/beta hydrolase n=1 Tax=Ramlibacter algicola TaxID=2795217 RepID=A0A934USI1_9BURK|nr:alpha/beta fold hydrolase [Ramlibacter algicola]MBK0394899.1 alpha/beta hydrolase [Ramlibacter algicola]
MTSAVVLVHGAWHGGWCWDKVRPRLEAAGHRVLAPSLTGLGDREHLRHPIPSLDTHVADIVDLVESEDLHGVVLVGHSYGGMVITGAADALRDRVRHLVYLDAAVPADGQTFASFVPGITPEDVARREAAFRSMAPDGAWLPPISPAMVGVSDPEDVAWLQRCLRPHPLRTWLDPLRLPHGGHAGLPKTYVLATNPPTTAMGYPRVAEIARGGEWTPREIDCGHDMMVVAPERTASLIAEAAA